ncbi:transcription elongation factor b polypeptide [Plakobranchus ocellatus]|uniref:Elongin-B n=1 Tax=Plakobranchus ocellatus TaxID=259542 RepID=A0AAV4BL99_9GAST|nr:transcription elongation factor b polypeptide [Plakobranchus ocellatus]
MDVFLMVRRKKTTIFTDAKESTTMGELKKMIEGILKVPPENQRLFKDDTAMTDDHKALSDYGYNSTVAKAQSPATIGLVLKTDEGEWESLDIHPLSSPPELPDVMKPQDASQAHQAESNAV